MRKMPLWVVYLIQFIVYFVMCALFLPSFPSTPKWAPGTTEAQMFWGLCRLNAPIWSALSAVCSGVGTAFFALLRRTIGYRH